MKGGGGGWMLTSMAMRRVIFAMRFFLFSFAFVEGGVGRGDGGHVDVHGNDFLHVTSLRVMQTVPPALHSVSLGFEVGKQAHGDDDAHKHLHAAP